MGFFSHLAAILCKPIWMYTQSHKTGIFIFKSKGEDFISPSAFVLSIALICSSFELAELQMKKSLNPRPAD